LRKRIVLYLIILTILFILTDAETAMRGMLDGIQICSQNLIPSLFPLFFLIGCLSEYTQEARFRSLSKPFQYCGISAGTESLFLMCLISGYPVGAATVQGLFSRGILEKKEARHLMAFCNNPGPAFIFGIGLSLFHNVWIPWIVWGILILSTLLVATILPRNNTTSSHCRHRPKRSPSRIMLESLKSTAMVCGWVLIFRVIIGYAAQILPKDLPNWFSAVIKGIFELSNGCLSLTGIPNESVQFVLFCAFLSFGGICVWMQILSAAENVISSVFYFGKLLQTILSTALSLLVQRLLFPNPIKGTVFLIALCSCLALLFLISFLIHRKNSSKAVIYGV